MDNAWREVDAGRRQLDWSVALGSPTEAEYLTPRGRDVATRAIMDLDQFLGTGWLHRATHPAPGVTGPTMGPYFASLLGPHAFIAAVGLWARLQLLVDAQAEGIGHLRRNLRANPTAVEFRHHMTLARLAVIAAQAGARIRLEPPKPQGGPGDLRAVRAGSDVFIEIRTLGPDQGFRAHQRHVDEATTHLRLLETRHDVHWDGQLPEEPTTQWKDSTAAAAAEVEATGNHAQVVVDGATLTARPGPAPLGTQITGPLCEADQGPRLVWALTEKAIKTHSSGAAWLWLEDVGALWPLTMFAREPLPQKINLLQRALAPLFDAHPHILGVVLTSGEMRLDGPLADITEHRGDGVAMRRTMPGGIVRESIVVHRRLNVPGQYALTTTMCAEEPGWLDHALARLGIPGGVTTLTAWPTHQTQLPAPGHYSGLYVPAQH